MSEQEKLENLPPEAAPGAAQPAAPSHAEPDVMPSLAEALRLAEQQAAEHHDAWLRAKADAENIRRRAQEDVAKASKFAAEKFATAMLAVKDSLEAALANADASAATMKDGVELTLKQLEQAFAGAGVTEVNPLGEKFDPHRHQAISQVEDDGEANRVVTVLQKGYLLHDRVLRAALVVVSKARSGGA
jgi:molecular chaperone GrpE